MPFGLARAARDDGREPQKRKKPGRMHIISVAFEESAAAKRRKKNRAYPHWT